MSLPFVRSEICCSLECCLKDETDAQYIKKQLKNLDQENPVVSQFIKMFARKCKQKSVVAMCGLMVYKLLESQAEADELKKLFE